jgi:hypothetical protein
MMPYDSFTDYPNGVTSFGVPLFGGAAKFATAAYGRTWFVNANSTSPGAGMNPGSNGNSGRSPLQPFLTMAKAFEVIDSGDVINFVGKIQEQLVSPVQVFDITINGCGNRPRHADSTPDGGQYGAAQWAPTSGGTAAQATLRVLQQGWRLTNFLMTAIDANAACLEVVRNAGAGDDERDASHLSALGMRFSGAGIGIRGGVAGTFTEIPYNVEVGGCQFDNMTYAMRAAIECNQWFIHDNVFAPNTNQIIMPLRNSLIIRNSIGAFTAAANSGGIDLNGGTGLNQVTQNNLSGTYSNAGGYRAANANDNWYGNYSSAGLTSADPA